MNKKKTMYTIAAACFVLAAHLSIEMIALWIFHDFSVERIVFIVLPLSVGSGMGAAGSILAMKNKSTVIYPIGFIVLCLPLLYSIVSNTYCYFGFNFIASNIGIALLFASITMIVVDAFIRPKTKVMGIIGIVLMLSADVALLVNSFILFSSSGGGLDLVLLKSFVFAFVYFWAAISALVSLLAREPRNAEKTELPSKPGQEPPQGTEPYYYPHSEYGRNYGNDYNTDYYNQYNNFESSSYNHRNY